MEVSVTNQAFIFLSSVIGGLIVGFVFDIFRILRRVIKTANFIIYLQDILFWILVTIIIFSLVFITNDGELRWYEFLGVILGVIFYNLLFSTYVIVVSVTVINFIKKVLLFIIKIILFPFVFIYKIFRKPCMFLLGTIKKIFRGLYKLIKKGIDKIVFSIKSVNKMLKKV
ncbi:MAG: hypothetical protein PWR27_1243 [Petroclostridium sp.]|uniref:spore cortex biosynthesis protein YabQ n=1 Tax=Petroclostridium xylanilyticum TaxID=1792311 RepID=UPI0012FFB2DC|nr:spore cortex biosynthesis protein YabQ [Petroclostridium xylanilyticum]MBZ4645084.1 yabQ [Clostridia bacterium]MDK2810534.1 hypothetical protein [Petroclostridium sp.]